MHYYLERPADVLGRNLQPSVAHNLGYGERSPSKRIEAFMRQLYRHSRNIFLITRTLEQRLALLPPARRRPMATYRNSAVALRPLPPKGRTPARESADGFKSIDCQ